MKVSASATSFKDFPRWNGYCASRTRETGHADPGEVKHSMCFLRPPRSKTLVLDQINGDDWETAFAPVEREVEPRASTLRWRRWRRPSNALPLLSICSRGAGDLRRYRLTGQWAASLQRMQRLRSPGSGHGATHLRLHPGETIRTQRILLMRWSGDRLEAHNQFRRLLLAQLPCPSLTANGANGHRCQATTGLRAAPRPTGPGGGQIAAAKVDSHLVGPPCGLRRLVLKATSRML